MRLINTILSFAIILFFAALIYVGYKSINYYNTHGGSEESLGTVLSESTNEVIAEAKDLGGSIEEGIEARTSAVLGEETDGEEGTEEEALEEEEPDTLDEALDEKLAKEKLAIEEEAKEEVTEPEAIKEISVSEETKKELSDRRPDDYDNTLVAKTVKEKPAPSINKKKKSSVPAYMVVAGTFSTNKNAGIEVARLKKLGYKPEIVNFRGSKLYAVIAGRAANSKEAAVIVNALKAKGVEAYARKRR